MANERRAVGETGGPHQHPTNGGSSLLTGTIQSHGDLPKSSAPLRARIVCAWCNEILDTGDEGAPTSHGSCLKCAAATLQQAGLPAGVARG